MKYRPALLVAVLLYVTLDLSLPAMPGAFVFDPADSIESIQAGRGRAATEVVMPHVPSGDAVLPSRRPEINDRRTPTPPVERRGRPFVSYLSRASSDPPSSSEDSH
jgi:hypothetical protein